MKHVLSGKNGLACPYCGQNKKLYRLIRHNYAHLWACVSCIRARGMIMTLWAKAAAWSTYTGTMDDDYNEPGETRE